LDVQDANEEQPYREQGRGGEFKGKKVLTHDVQKLEYGL
jgi:hypothetical protein